MSRSFSDNIFFLGRYLQFFRHSVTRYRVHSPYIYNLISEVIRPGAPAGLFAPVEELRRNYLRSRDRIVKTDWGVGAAGSGPYRYPVKLRSLARTSLVPSYRAARLFHLVRFLKAGSILELGTSLGISAAYMAKADPLARIITLEGCPELSALARKNFQALGLENIVLVEGDFDHSLSGALNGLGQPDLVFFDGNHRYEPTMRYYRECLARARDSSVFVIDDIHYSREMEQAWEEIRHDERVTVSIDLFHMGMVLFRKELSRQHFILRYP